MKNQLTLTDGLLPDTGLMMDNNTWQTGVGPRPPGSIRMNCTVNNWRIRNDKAQ